MSRRMCEHCKTSFADRTGRLCQRDRMRPHVRALYPSTSKFGRRGHGSTGTRTEAETPTQAAPGSNEKLAVLRERAAKGQNLFHRGDLTGVLPEPAFPRRATRWDDDDYEEES